MKLEIKQGSLAEVECDVIVVNLFEGVKQPGGATGAVDKALDGLISKFVIEEDDFKGEFGKTYAISTYGKIPAKKVLLVGLGKSEDFNLNKLRELSAKVINRCNSFLKAKKVCSILHGAGTGGLNPSDCAKMIAEGTIIGAYNFDKYKSKKDEKYNGVEEFSIVEIKKEVIEQAKQGFELGKTTAEAVNFARDLTNEPASEMTPAVLAETAVSLKGLETIVIEYEDCLNMGMGAYCAVAKGSSQPSKFIHIKYLPKNPKKKIALIGKGITFDSGGLDIKPPASMLTMKSDMSGAAAVIAVMRTLAILKPQVEVHGIIAACENMPGGNAFKPGDVVKAMNGKYIEIDNTDAEGRLTLADALCYANEFKPDEIIDIATLTGACVVALGNMAAGLMGNDKDLSDKLTAAADKGGERLWSMPMYEEYMEGLKSEVADFKNAGGRYAGTSTAALFLKEFVDKNVWAHIDIAGVAFLDKQVKELSKGATGAGVRTLLNYILD